MLPLHPTAASWFVALALLAGCGEVASPTEPLPRCESPAPLERKPASVRIAGSYIVLFHAGTNAEAEAQRLSRTHGFRVTSVWQAALLGFAASDVTADALAGLRCEPSVKSVSENQMVPPP